MTLHVKVEAGTPTFVAGYEATPWGAGGWTINVPAGVQEGDLGFIVTGRDDGNPITATDPPGWTRVIPDTVATNSNWRILTRVREAGDASTIAFGAGISGTVAAFWYRNARLGSVGTIWKRSGTVATVTCPSLTRSVAGSVLLAIAGDRSVAATAGEQGYTSVTGATYARRYEGNPTLSAAIQICATFYAEIAPAGPPSDVVWTLNDSSTNAFGMQLELIPSGAWRKVSQPYLKLTNAWRAASAVFTKVNGEWREVWPGASGAVKIIGPTHRYESYIKYPAAAGIDNVFVYPQVPFYYVVGDKNRVHSAKVEMRWTPTGPKSGVEHTISWDITNDWGIYHVGWRVDATTTKYYYAGMLHTEAAAIAPPKYATLMWSPRDGGRFAYMPVCWDESGLTTLPVRDDAAGGLDSHTGYAPFPPGRSAVKTSDGTPISLNNTGDSAYTVSNGYSDMNSGSVYFGGLNYTMVTITLRDVNAGVLASWSGPLPWDSSTHVPGTGIGPLSMGALRAATAFTVEGPLLYWPEEWNGLFDRLPYETQMRVDIRFGQTLPTGAAEWWVFDETGERIGDFRLAMRKGVTDTVEIHGVNLKPDLVGMGIMKAIVRYGTIWCPTRYVVLEPPNQPTYDVMRSWGWVKLEDAPMKSKSYMFHLTYDPTETDKYLFYDTYVPMYNRFSELGFPPPDEVMQW